MFDVVITHGYTIEFLTFKIKKNEALVGFLLDRRLLMKDEYNWV